MTTGGYIQNYATDPTGPVGLDRGPVLWAVSASAVSWLIFTIIAGSVSDKIGRKNTYLLGWMLLLIGIFSLFPLVNTGSIWMLFLGLVILTVGLGFTYGQHPLQRALLGSFGVLRDRVDPRRCLRTDDREGPGVGHRHDHLGGHLPGARHPRLVGRHTGPARPFRHPSRTRSRGRTVCEPDHRRAVMMT